MPTSKSCPTTAAINKTSRSTIHESFRDYRYSCADAKSTSPQCLPANATSARKKHSPPNTAASPTTHSPNSTSAPPTPNANAIRPTPAYDLLTTQPYSGWRDPMAPTLYGRVNRLDRAHFLDAAVRLGLRDRAAAG
jgi:hypothetical protein